MDWITIVGIVIAACIVTWLVSSQYSRSKLSSKIVDAEKRASESEARVDELRRQVAEAGRDFEQLRQKLGDSETTKAVALARVEEVEKAFHEQRATLDEAKLKLSDTFKALAADALAGNNKGFLNLAEERFRSLKDEAKTDLDIRKQSIEDSLKSVNEVLALYQKESRDFNQTNVGVVSAVGEQLRSLVLTQVTLQNETAKLVNALKTPQVRGRYGEIALRRTAELAGMTKHCDFIEQESVVTLDGILRPDMIVKLPSGREVVVDSKVPMAGFMEAIDATDDVGRKTALERHKNQLNDHVLKLSNKKYWDQFATSPEFVVMFVLSDSILAAAAEQDPNLIESALNKNVVIATPSTFIALLKAIAFGWRQETIAASAKRISELGVELSERLATMAGHFVTLRNSLTGSIKSYNDVVGSFESRVLSTARKFKELGAGGRKEIEELQPVDLIPRTLTVAPPEDDQELPG